jgi:(1->4)-alpha-D-glucan 1-alpha-D-glucosylmutase
MLYQTLVGAWPPDGVNEDFVQRIEDYAIKAAREGKRETSWLNPDGDYERGLREFVRVILDPESSPVFVESLGAFARRAALLGAVNSLAQLVLKAAMPGVPDFYQGTEHWDLSLVDPDNRRPLDFCRRQRELASLGHRPDWNELAKNWRDGRIKLALTRRLLALRREFPALFRDGRYEPVDVLGPDRDHVIAFVRNLGRARLVVAVARHGARATGDGMHWPRDFDAVLQCDSSGLADALGTCGAGWQSLELSRLFAALPVAALLRR